MTLINWLLLITLIVNCIQLAILIINLQELRIVTGRKRERKQQRKDYI
jgi:hypothetical protein